MPDAHATTHTDIRDPARIACPECDLLLRLPDLEPGQTALCPRCDFAIAQRVRDGYYRPMTYAISALLFLCIALTTPFLSMQASGLGNTMTLPQMIRSMVFFDQEAVAALLLCFIVLIPGLALIGIILLCLTLLRRQLRNWVIPLARLLFTVNPWAMVEVFAIGVLVSLVKIAGMAKVTLGFAFWGYLAFALCFLLAMKNLNRYTVWTTIERLSSERPSLDTGSATR